MILLAAKTAIKEPKRSSALVRRETFASYCFLLPSLIFFLGFVIYPMVLCVVTSFFDSTMNLYYQNKTNHDFARGSPKAG